MAGLIKLQKRNCKIIGLSVDEYQESRQVTSDIEETQGHKVNYPMIGDPELKIAKLYDMLPADAGVTSEGRTPANNATVRTVFIVGPDKKIKLMLSYPMSTGRNFDEVLRVLDSINSETPVATPVNWKQGDDVILTAAVSDEEAKEKYPGSAESKPYIRSSPNKVELWRGPPGLQSRESSRRFFLRCIVQKSRDDSRLCGLGDRATSKCCVHRENHKPEHRIEPRFENASCGSGSSGQAHLPPAFSSVV